MRYFFITLTVMEGVPIETASEEWEQGDKPDPLRIQINQFLSKNSGQAYSISELAEYVVENVPSVTLLLSDDLSNIEYEQLSDSKRNAIEAYVATTVDLLEWADFVDWKTVTDENGNEEVYVTERDEGIWVRGLVLDRISDQIDQIEGDVGELTKKLQNTDRQSRRVSDEIQELKYQYEDLQQEIEEVKSRTY